MDIYTTYNAAFQAVAAFVIFVVGYVARFISVLICVLVAYLMVQGARMLGTQLTTLRLRAVKLLFLARNRT